MPKKDKRCRGASDEADISPEERRFVAEGHYAEHIVRWSLGHVEESLAALELAYEVEPGYAPVVLTLGSIEYQRGQEEQGRELLLSLVSLPAESMDGGEDELAEIIDKAGDFLIQHDHHIDGLLLYRAAAERFPDKAAFHQGIGCCAGAEGLYEEGVAASEVALRLEPDNQQLVNDLGWSLFQAGRLQEARDTLARAVDMDPQDELARENLRLCDEALAKNVKGHR